MTAYPTGGYGPFPVEKTNMAAGGGHGPPLIWVTSIERLVK